MIISKETNKVIGVYLTPAPPLVFAKPFLTLSETKRKGSRPVLRCALDRGQETDPSLPLGTGDRGEETGNNRQQLSSSVSWLFIDGNDYSDLGVGGTECGT